MANTLSKTGISTDGTITAAHISQSIDALTGTQAYDITISGSLIITGSTISNSQVFDNTYYQWEVSVQADTNDDTNW